MRYEINEIYERLLQENYENFNFVNPDVASRYMEAVTEKEKKPCYKKGLNISEKEFLNHQIEQDLKQAKALDFADPRVTRSYFRIYNFLKPIIHKYKLELAYHGDKSLNNLT